MLKKIIVAGAVFGGLFSTAPANAVPFINCPTLQPLPIIHFEAAAMQPIDMVVDTFDVAMNTTILNAVILASNNLTNAIGNSNMNLMKAVIESSQSKAKDELELEKNMFGMEQEFDSQLSGDLELAKGKLFPGDAVKDESGNVVASPDTPTYEYVKNMCTMGKMHQVSTSRIVKDLSMRTQNRRNQKLSHALESVSSVMAATKRNVDAHYDMFCSQDDVDSGLCESASAAPNADISAFNFFYPVGQIDQNKGATDSYRTLYTYNPVESFAAYQYVQNITGYIGVAPPTQNEINQVGKAEFVGRYKQLMASMSLVSDAMLGISALREPVNSTGVVMSELDVLNYQISQTNHPDQVLLDNSASDTGKRMAMVKNMAINNKLRYMLLLQEDVRRRVKAAAVALEGLGER